jgi:molybdopterin-guanine dinucleotide biosynthesis protein A
MSISAVILAGGKSSRMGRDKSLLPFGEYSTMAEYQYRKLEKIFNNKVYISTRDDKFPFMSKKLYDKYEILSPLNGIISSFSSLKSDAILFLAVDMPFISHNSIEKLLNLYKNNPNYDCYCFKVNNRLEPTVAIYRRTILTTAKKNFNNNIHKLGQLIKMSRYLCINSVNENEFTNLNFFEEYLSKKI